MFISVYHFYEVKLKMRALNLGRPVEIPKLNENMAIELGANLLGEGIIVSIAATILIAEYLRLKDIEAAKEQKRKDAIQRICDKLGDLELEARRKNAQLEAMTQLYLSLKDSQQLINTVDWNSGKVVSSYEDKFQKEESSNRNGNKNIVRKHLS